MDALLSIWKTVFCQHFVQRELRFDTARRLREEFERPAHPEHAVFRRGTQRPPAPQRSGGRIRGPGEEGTASTTILDAARAGSAGGCCGAAVYTRLLGGGLSVPRVRCRDSLDNLVAGQGAECDRVPRRSVLAMKINSNCL